MANTMTPSITAGQMVEMIDKLAALCHKNKSSLPSDIVKRVLKTEGDALAEEQFIALRKRVELHSEMIVRHFKLDRTKTREQMIMALGRVPYVNVEVLATMPIDGPEEGDLLFFPLKRYMPVAEIARAFDEHGLKPHYVAQIQVNVDDPSFADEYPNGMQWGDNCYAAFDSLDGEHEVRVNADDDDWDDDCWFAGIPK